MDRQDVFRIIGDKINNLIIVKLILQKQVPEKKRSGMMLRIFFGFILFFALLCPAIQSGGYYEKDLHPGQSYYRVMNDDLSVCSYSHLLMLYPNTDLTYVKDGISHRYTGSLRESHINAIISAYNNLHFLIADGSANMEYSLLDIVVINTPISKITSLGPNMYYLSSDDIKDDLLIYAPAGKYDSVHVVWNNGPIDSYWGMGGSLINGGKTTFDSIISGNEWWWGGSKYILGQVFLHEWLHGVCRYYAGLGFTMPVGDADGGGSHGYSYDPVLGWMTYYRDLMQGKVWEPAYSKHTGITKEAWSRGTPNQTPLKITSPNGGEQWKEGEIYNITWVHLGQTGYISVDLFKNELLKINLRMAPVEAKTLLWSIPIGLADRKNYSDYKIRISNNLCQDFSDKTFSIIPISSEAYFWLTISTTVGGTTTPSPGFYLYKASEQAVVNITALPDINSRFIGWTGDVTSQTNPIAITMNRDISITANFLKIIYPPLNASGQKVLNRSLSQAEYINVLTWDANPNNEDIVNYRIYLVEGTQKALLATLGSGSFKYWHRKVEKNKTYTYWIVGVNSSSREGDPAIVAVR